MKFVAVALLAVGALAQYENPYTGDCAADEQKATNITANGNPLAGGMCLPECKKITNACPAAPSGVTAQAKCAVQDESSKKKYCCLLCKPLRPKEAGCGDGGMKCEKVNELEGICLWQQSGRPVFMLQGKIMDDAPAMPLRL